MRKVALRGLFARKTRLALTALAVSLGVMLIAGTYVFTDTINSSFDRLFSASYATTDVVVSPSDAVEADQFGSLDPIPAGVVDRIRQVPQVGAVGGSIFDQDATILDDTGDPIGARSFIASVQDVERFEAFTVAEGRMPRGPDEVALDRSTASRKGFAVGGSVDIVDKQPRKTYTIVGLVQVAGVESYGGAAVALMTLPEAQRMAGKSGRFDEIAVAAAPGITRQQLRDAVRRAVPEAKYDVRTGQEQADDQAAGIKDDLSFLPTALLAFAGISLFVGAFIIFNTFSITVAQRAREFALLRTLGASRGQVLRSVLTEGLVLGALGSLVGLALGIAVAKGLKALFSAVGFDLPAQGTVLESRTVVVSLVVGTVVTLLASLAPALRATRVPPVAALREGVALPQGRSSRFAFPASVVLTGIGVALLVVSLAAVDDATTGLSLAGAGAAATFLGVGLMSPKLVGPIAAVVGTVFGRGVTARLARRNSVRQPGRTAATAAALMIGVALVSFASIFASSAKETISGFIDRGMAGDAVIQNQNGFAPFSGAAAEQVSRIEGVETLSGFRFAQVVYDGEKEGVTGIDPSSVTAVYNVSKGERVVAGLRRGQVAVSEDFAEDHGVRTGETISVRTARKPRLPLEVAGVYEDEADLLGDLVLPIESVAEDIGVARDSYVFLKLAGDADEDATREAVGALLERDFPQTEVLTAEAFKDDQAGQIDQLLGLIYALLALAVIVAAFGIVNTLALSITERTRELGMLRAIGTSRKQVKSMIRKESVIIAVIGGVLGLAVGVGLSVVFTQALDDIVLHVPFVSLVLLLVLSALAGALAAALPARRAAKLDVLEALAHE